MYQSSNGELKDVKTMDTSYMINALSKAYKEIWNSLTIEQFKMYKTNINVLREELDERINKFDLEKNGAMFL